METVKWTKASDCESASCVEVGVGVWTKSSDSGTTECVEIAKAEDVWVYRPQGAAFAMRATELDATAIIWLTKAELRAFLSGVKKGDFDFLLEE